MNGAPYLFSRQPPRWQDGMQVQRIEVADVAQLASQFVESGVSCSFRNNAIRIAKPRKQGIDDDGVGDAVVGVGERSANASASASPLPAPPLGEGLGRHRCLLMIVSFDFYLFHRFLGFYG